MDSALNHQYITLQNMSSYCRLCLSTNRKLHDVESVMYAFGLMTDWEPTKGSRACWECTALLSRIASFKLQAARAKHTLEALYNNQIFDVPCMSNLTKVTKYYYDKIITFEHCESPTEQESDQAIQQTGSDTQPSEEIKSYEEVNNQIELPKYTQGIDIDKDDIEIDLESYKGTSDNECDIWTDALPFAKTEPDETKTAKEKRRVKKEKKKIKKEKNKHVKKEKQLIEIEIPNEKFNLSDFENLDENEVEMYQVSSKELSEYKARYLAKEKSKNACRSCMIFFKNATNRKRHDDEYHSESAGPHECDLCNRRFATQEHMAAHHYQHSFLIRCLQSGCNFVHHRREIMKYHRFKHWNNIAPDQAPSIGKDRKRDMLSDDNLKANYECHVCGKGFKIKYGLELHMRIHTIEPKFQCKTCNRFFKFEMSFKSHMRTHNEDRPFSCDICNKTFKFKPSIITHLRQHREKRKYICKVCNKELTTNNSLKLHMVTHTGEKPHMCDYCSKSFAFRSSLVQHVRIHTGERPYECNICKRSFLTRKNLKAHMISHTGERAFKCEVCKKMYSSSNSLRVHMRLHTGERPFSCHMCEKTFVAKYHLESHILTHTGERPYCCHLCGKTFRSTKACNAHISNHSRRLFCNVCKITFKSKKALNKHLKTAHKDDVSMHDMRPPLTLEQM